MLPILRVIPVGGVFLAIAILILALNPPGNPRTRLPGLTPPATGAMMTPDTHPEWWQFLMLAALRRADELNRLRELPDTPVKLPLVEATPKRPEKVPEVAAVPKDGNDAEPEHVTGTIVRAPDAKIPVEIGETSSTELPVISHEERPPVMTPERAKLPHRSKAESTLPPKKTVRRARRSRLAAAKPQSVAQSNFFESLFGAGAALPDKLRTFTVQ